MRRRAVIYCVTLIIAFILITPILTAPLLLKEGGFSARLGTLSYLVASGLCHQLPERSYFWNGIQMAVCQRCSGIYAGALLGLLFYPFTPYFRKGAFPSLKILLIFILPVGIDLFLATVGIWRGEPSIRTITGLMAGFISVLYMVPGLEEMINILTGKEKKTP